MIRPDRIPTFHDAELVTIDHRPADQELRLRFRRVDADRKALFVLEPSCGAEDAVLCETIRLDSGPDV
ncbi:hypothetical protein BLA23254_01625 [Burkholderia lata]|uniref:Uncharacterized protein n=1 Tax=Burkholderia lata (strain ATCC 17760 / DSM 23089 / LMG 22485 / NCIMB 9086 / R18194 / 383) TaxID=482957 RepID=A0A6P2J1R2_BURL3|nr:hypothetical protein [Burkholderia lata]VWB37044.1 hypothetical protein BLA23254_01625 [Burkholderia lata]